MFEKQAEACRKNPALICKKRAVRKRNKIACVFRRDRFPEVASPG